MSHKEAGVWQGILLTDYVMEKELWKGLEIEEVDGWTSGRTLVSVTQLLMMRGR